MKKKASDFSRPLYQVSDETGEGPVCVADYPEPPPRNWIVARLIPEGATTVLHGDGGVGKSLVAMLIGICVAAGAPFLSLNVQPGKVLWVDAELEMEEFLRRAYRLARGIGLLELPRNLSHLTLHGSLISPKVQDELKEVVHSLRPSLVVIDSLTIGAFGADPNAAREIIVVMKAIRRLGTVLGIDHIAKPARGRDSSEFRPFGSAFKFNQARSVIRAEALDDDAIVLRGIKANFAELAKPMFVAREFSKDAIQLRLLPDDDARVASYRKDGAKSFQRVLDELRKLPDGATAKVLAQNLGMAEGTVSNALTALRRRFKADRSPKGIWTPLGGLEIEMEPKARKPGSQDSITTRPAPRKGVDAAFRPASSAPIGNRSRNPVPI